MEKVYCSRPGYRPDLFAFGIGYDTSSVGISGVEGLYNVNISETHWRSGSDNALRSYGYRYDALNRLTDAFYKRESLATNGYNEHISYDPNGNITMLQRFGGLDEQNISLEIDNLGYRYGAGSNKLLAVGDASGSPEGFSDGTNSGDDFAYDASGNMISDKNKNITSIAYNHLDLPVRIVFGGDLNTRVDYAYDALGAKLQKTVVQYNPVGDHSIVLTSVTDYLGFQYKDGVLQFFPTSEGYVSHTKGSYSYVYNYTDHLGNVRMSYAKNPARPSELKVIEENHYYPFGLKHQNYNSEEFLFDKKDSNLQLRAPIVKEALPFQYKYNGKEFQEELGLNLYDYQTRNYDPALGRWMNIDNHADSYFSISPYSSFANNPVSFVDPTGEDILFWQWAADDKDPHGGKWSQVGFDKLDKKIQKGVLDFLETKSGQQFFAQFAKKGDKIGNFKFTKDGSKSEHDLSIVESDYRMGAEGRNEYAGWKSGINFQILLNKDMDNPNYNIPETLGHEVFLHMNDYMNDYIKAFKKNGWYGSDAAYKKRQESDPEGYKEHLNMTNDQNGKAQKYYEFISQLKGVLNPKQVQKQVDKDRVKNFQHGTGVQNKLKKSN